jgi:MFS transporter, DHA1 family, multidrug resistance protein
VAMRFQETVPRKNLAALQPGTLLRTWIAIVRHPTFIAYSALSVATYAGLFTFLGASSFVFIKVLGYTRLQYSLALFTMAFFYTLGTFLCRRLLPRLGIKRSVAVGGLISVTGGTLLGVLAYAGVQGYWAILGPFMIYMVGHGVHQPCGNSGAVGPFPQAAGAASAMNGFFMMLAAFAVGGWIGPRLDGTVFTLTNGVWFWSVCVALAAWTLVRRHGGPA